MSDIGPLIHFGYKVKDDIVKLKMGTTLLC